MPSISIDPDLVDGTARTLQAGATEINTAGTKAGTLLGSADGLPPAFVRKAASLANEVKPTCLYASDVIAVSGIELSRRAEIARIVDANRLADGYPVAHPGSTMGAAPELSLWNDATRAHAKATPGAYFKDIAAALALPGAAAVTTLGSAVKQGPDKIMKAAKLPKSPSMEQMLSSGTTVSLEQAVHIADTSGTGIAIAIGRNGLLKIGRR